MFDSDSPHDDDDRAVSPVIGVILMVAITVILAAVIGTFVLNLGGSVQQNVQAGASVECNGDGSTGFSGSADVTWTSNQNAEKLQITEAASTNSSGSTPIDISNVGDSTTLDQGDSSKEVDVSLTVTAVKGEQSTVITTKSCTL